MLIDFVIHHFFLCCGIVFAAVLLLGGIVEYLMRQDDPDDTVLALRKKLNQPYVPDYDREMTKEERDEMMKDSGLMY